jgi:hypothetical protein
MEPQYRNQTKRIRPFVQSAEVSNRGCSIALQRVVTDFGADQAFAKVMDKLVEHYGIVLGESTIRRITEEHARKIFEMAQGPANPSEPPPRSATQIIVEMDGGMVPIVEPDATQSDQRKGKSLLWKEAKICLAHAEGSKSPSYGGTLQGDVETAGSKLLECANSAGFDSKTYVHGVGDGAPWIADQVEDQFGSQGHYLLDFFHVCEYLSAAGKAIHTEAASQDAWIDEQKVRLKTGRSKEFLQALLPHLEDAQVTDANAPVRQCHRYLSNRQEQLDYPEAAARELPIGSGEIESAHRYIVQQRLKLPGAWWRAANAEHMLALRLNRANGQWGAYWAEHSKLAA